MSISGSNKLAPRAPRARGILLDLDDTLYPYAPCDAGGRKAAFKYLAKRLKKNEKEVAKFFALARAKVKRQIPETGASHSRLLYFQNTIEMMHGKSEPLLAFAAEKIFWKAYFSKMKLRPGVKQFLAEAKKRHIKIAIVSDFTTEIQIKKLVHLDIAQFIDFLVTSEESGRDKPAPNSFRLALKKMTLRPSEVIMIGDDTKRDKIGAKRMGIPFSSVHSFIKDKKRAKDELSSARAAEPLGQKIV